MDSKTKQVYINLYYELSDRIFHSFGASENKKLKEQRREIAKIIKDNGGF